MLCYVKDAVCWYARGALFQLVLRALSGQPCACAGARREMLESELGGRYGKANA